MTVLPSDDRLLRFTRICLTLMIGLTLVAGSILALTIPIFLIGPGSLHQRLAESGIGPDQLPRVAALMALLVGLAVLTFLFLRQLRHIVESVSEGDPFVPINADRLRHMAWLALAMQAILIPVTGLIVWIDALPQKANVHYADNNWFGGLILALLLFVLARVFRVGTEMRDELEGTV